MMKTIYFLIAILLIAPPVFATHQPWHQTYQTNRNQLDPNSLNNPLGRLGSPLSPQSPHNPLGKYGLE